MSLCISRLIGASLISTRPSLTSTSLAVNPTSHVSTSKNKDLASCGVHGYSSRNLQYDPALMIARRNFAVQSNITPPPGAPLPSGSPPGSMKSWVLCIVLTFVLPFCTHKWGPLLQLKNKVDTVVQTAEHIIEAIEGVAGKVDKVIDDITDDLPENSKLRKQLEAVDELVEGVAKSAHIANDIIDKVEEAEEKLESLIISETKLENLSKQVVEKTEVPTQETSALKLKNEQL
ncbi:hypothetical protein L1887_23837 [Cichorium endivia]|nr:hypothetical protein L1887_23837 [Cichorium endivia]